ncbi:hypothetical protein FVR03_07990 [Pontibacter qinzhouensis]|uniref:RHS repeat protein n=1 Tax=Pontibacter qinzhouensis TaxID=2603253 RepID=A0A5C8K9R6_9BACT|nr:hypothetical protein [Pontibacter qinzhouensis]TXK48630.1 hypothetical protein FVR03_07990 [Pontibacter qinzhouensis]
MLTYFRFRTHWLSFSIIYIFIFLFSCQSTVTEAQEIDPVYGEPLDELYKTRKVKEVFIERDQYYNGQLLYQRYLFQYFLIDENGYKIRRENSHNNRISNRLDMEYDAKGHLLASTYFQAASGKETAETDRKNIVWVQATQNRYAAPGRENGGEFRWDAINKKWNQISKIKTWVQNDTTYTETRTSYSNSFELTEVSRDFLLGKDKNILRHDYISFSPKGMSEANYYYTKLEDERVVESGKVDFEMEVLTFLERHPEYQRLLFSKNGFKPVVDKVARQSEGTLKPNSTFTYNGAGLLVEKKEYSERTIYQRDAKGRAITERSEHEGSAGRLITYYYNESGLVEKEVRTYSNGAPEETRFYRYSFY